MLAFTAGHARAGSLFYVGIPGNDSDAGSGLSTANAYTSAVSGGSGGPAVGGIPFSPLEGSGNSVSGNNVTLSAASGTLAAGGGRSATIQADGTLGQILSKMVFNDGAENSSEQYIVLDPASLEAGKTYDLRIYICNPSNQNRQVNLSFAGDGQAPVETDFFNEDDATTSPGGFADPNQVYYIDYRFAWDGATTPGVTITQRAGNTPFSFYALTNQEVPGGSATPLPAGAVAAAPIAAPPEPAEPTAGAIQTDDADVADNGGDVGVSSETFYADESLQRHGQWVEVANYGRCWQPTEVSADWRPYTAGRWCYSANRGWAWDSDEEWGWATYHYGRWCRADSHWIWVPGRVWAPSWCSWRYGGGHVGWAPLPPDASFVVGVGIGSWADSHYDVGPAAYSFCAVRDFGAPHIAQVVVQPQQNITFIQKTINVTNITNVNHVVYSGGPNFTSINNTIVRGGGRPLQPVVIQRNTVNVVAPGAKLTQLKGNVLSFGGPKFVPTAKPAVLPKVAATIPAAHVDKGWGEIRDPKVANQLKGKITRESQGLSPQTAPARLTTAEVTKIGGPAAVAAEHRAPGAIVAKPGVIRPGIPVTQLPAGGFHKPGQPAGRPGETAGKPGQPVTPGEPVARPGKPARPGENAVKPGQPVTGVPEEMKPGKPGRRPGEVVEKPGQPPIPGEPATVPGKPVRPGEEAVRPGQPTQPAVTPGEAKPGKPGRKPGENVERLGQPVIPGEPATVPGKPVRPGEEAVRPGQPTMTPGEAKPGKPGRRPGESFEKPGQPAVVPEELTPRKPAQPVPEEPVVRPGKPERKPAEPGIPNKPGARPGATERPPVTQEESIPKPGREEKPARIPEEKPVRPIEKPERPNIPEPALRREPQNVPPPAMKRPPVEERPVEKREPAPVKPQAERRPETQPQPQRNPEPQGARPGGGAPGKQPEKGKGKATPAPQ